MTHPLTEEMMGKIHGDEPGYSNPYDEDDMRAAYDLGRAEQLEQVMKWLHGNLDEYSTDTDPGFFWSMSRLLPDLEKAMRPQENNK